MTQKPIVEVEDMPIEVPTSIEAYGDEFEPVSLYVPSRVKDCLLFDKTSRKIMDDDKGVHNLDIFAEALNRTPTEVWTGEAIITALIHYIESDDVANRRESAKSEAAAVYDRQIELMKARKAKLKNL